MFFHHVPRSVQLFFPGYIWRKSRKERAVYLTFDDGPVPGITDFVLEELGKRGMKATFFMVGDNIVKHPELAIKVREEGHQIGNHTQHHLNGYQYDPAHYLEDFLKCQSTIQEVLAIQPDLFRAPYGRMRRQQRKAISRTHKVVMWDVIPGDFDALQASEVCLSKAKQYTKSGSIILFHDQKKTEKVLVEILPDFLDFIQEKGYATALL